MTNRATHREDRNCLSWWFPRLQGAGLPVPETQIIWTECQLIHLCDGETPIGFAEFVKSLSDAAEELGGAPIFLRTGQGSGKHHWKDTCYVPHLNVLPCHVTALVEWSHLVDIMGLPHHVWAVRKLLPTSPIMVATEYGNMPVCREFRCFVRDDKLACVHAYWPRKSLEHGFPIHRCANPMEDDLDDIMRDLPLDFDAKYDQLCAINEKDYMVVTALAIRAGKALGGAWSVDLLETKDVWYVTDCAIASRSFHLEGCANAAMFQRD
jgi:hypothetical protein